MKGQNILCDGLLRRFAVQKQLVLKEFCCLMKDNNFYGDLYNQYFAGCKIPNGLCKFDLLRFSDNTVLNIQLIPKGCIAVGNGWSYTKNIMCKNYFYLRHTHNKVICYCFCGGGELYKFDSDVNCSVLVGIDTLHSDLCAQKETLQSEIEVYKVFNHTKFLISPLNNTYAFVNGEYYLTDEQQIICDDILDRIDDKQCFVYAISSLVGAGKSMMIYHIAKQLKQNFKQALIIHGSSYNDGQLRLKMQYGFDICTTKEIMLTLQCLKISNKQYNAVLVDDGQHFTWSQINYIVNIFLSQEIPVILAHNISKYEDIKESSDFFAQLQSAFLNTKIYSRYIENNLRYKYKIDFTF